VSGSMEEMGGGGKGISRKKQRRKEGGGKNEERREPGIQKAGRVGGIFFKAGTLQDRPVNPKREKGEVMTKYTSYHSVKKDRKGQGKTLVGVSQICRLTP